MSHWTYFYSRKTQSVKYIINLTDMWEHWLSLKRLTVNLHLSLSKPISTEQSLGYFYMNHLLSTLHVYFNLFTSTMTISCTIYSALFRNLAHASIKVNTNKTSTNGSVHLNNIPPHSVLPFSVHWCMGLSFIL